MRIIVQRVSSASVHVNGSEVASIPYGILALVGITHSDTPNEVSWMAQKLLDMRIFPDEAGTMNRSVSDIHGHILVVSQFTLYGQLHKGTRPSYMAAARPDVAEPLYQLLISILQRSPHITVAHGIFGAMMDVSLVNSGPVTIILEREAP